jgi:hypothetical protein
MSPIVPASAMHSATTSATVTPCSFWGNCSRVGGDRGTDRGPSDDRVGHGR